MNPFGRGARGRDSEVGGPQRRRSTRGSSGGSLDPADQRFSKSARYHVICVNRFDPAVFFCGARFHSPNFATSALTQTLTSRDL